MRAKDRCFLCLLLTVLLITGLVEAQQTKKVPRIGVLWPEGPEDVARQAMTTALLEGLREVGYIDARNIAFDYRYTGEGRSERVRELAAELVSLKVDIIVTSGIQATRAAKNTTKRFPSL